MNARYESVMDVRMPKLTWAIIPVFIALSGTWPDAVAQPRITIQPRNAAVLPGQDAQFRLLASGTDELAYQWRFCGTPIPEATSNSLTLSNVALAQLGCYDVTISNDTGSVTSAPAWLLLATRWTDLVYFGASDGLRKCDGPPWNDQLAARLGVPLLNYAVDGINSTVERTRITSYLRDHQPTTNTLITFWTGGVGVDMILGASAEQAASNRLDEVRTLAVAGARDFLIPRFWPTEVWPFALGKPIRTNEVSIRYDILLDEGLEKLKADHGLTVFRPDMYAFFKSIWDNPAVYGFRDPPGADFWCDGLHLTFAAHRLVSQECYRWMTPPSFITMKTGNTPDALELQWQGGSAPFRVQHCEDLVSGVWLTEALTFQTNAVIAPSEQRAFYRVLHLGQ